MYGISHSAGNLAAAEATGAYVDMLGGTVLDNLNTLYVGLPCTVRTSVGMAHLDAKRNTLVAIFTLRHLMLHLLAYEILINSLLIIPERNPKSKIIFSILKTFLLRR